MLYITTRTKDEYFSPNDALTMNRGPEGGFFLPEQMPVWTDRELRAAVEKRFPEAFAEVLNQLFDTKLDSWAVEFAIGRQAVPISDVGGKVLIAEAWNNPTWKFDRLALGAAKAVMQSDQVGKKPSDWIVIASAAAVLYSVYGQLVRLGKIKCGEPVDVSVSCGNFSVPMAAWYARSWGLPIQTVICCCNENNFVWSLLSKGDLRTAGIAAHTTTPDCDYAVPGDLERLIYAVSGREEALKFCWACRTGSTYHLDERINISKGIYTPVIGSTRVDTTIQYLYKTFGYIANPHTALAYSGIMDYRTEFGESNITVVLSEKGPMLSLEHLSKVLGLSPEQLKKQITHVEA